VEIEVAIGRQAHEDREVSLRQRGAESSELSRAERSVVQGVGFLGAGEDE